MMHTDNNTIVICLAAYNGEAYLRQQLDSILAQTHKNWILLVRDDGSADATPDILKAYAAEYPQKIRLLEGGERLGVQANFAALHAEAKALNAPYCGFCDQDDVWLPDKLERSLAKLRQCRGPALVHTDLTVVDRELQVLGASFFSYRALNPRVKKLNRLLIQNNATGCTMLWNRELNALIDLDQPGAVLHAWWVALAASAFGTILCLEEPTVLYRQHGANTLGATRVNSSAFIAKWGKDTGKARDSLKKATVQAGAFAARYRDLLDPEQLQTVKRFADLYRRGKLARLAAVLRRGYWKQGLLQIFGELLLI